MDSVLVSKASLFTVFFLAYSLLEVTGLLPQEIRSAGLALSSLFSRFYGQEVGKKKWPKFLYQVLEATYIKGHFPCSTTPVLPTSGVKVAFRLLSKGAILCC